MKSCITLAFLLITLLGFAQTELKEHEHYGLPDEFDVATMTDSTRFKPRFDTISPQNYSFSIYDRSKVRVFTTDIPQQGWNGLHNNRGPGCQEGLYMWSLSFRDASDSTDHAVSGFVILKNPLLHPEIIALDTIQCQPTFYVPNSFCPNCDGINDVFIPVFGCAPVEYEMFIYDRWGNAIFRSVDHTTGWDGSLNAPMPSDTYVWRIRCRFYPGDKLRIYTGHVNLIR